MSKIFRMRPERCSSPALDWVMKEQLQFAIRVPNAHLSGQTPHIGAVWPGSGSCQGSPTASRRKKRGLDTSLSPRPVTPPCGESAGVWPIVTHQCPRPRPRPPRLWSRSICGVLSGSGACAGENECCSPICPACRFTSVTRSTPWCPFSTLCAVSCLRASSIAD